MHWAPVHPEHPVRKVQMHAQLALGWEHPLVTQGRLLHLPTCISLGTWNPVLDMIAPGNVGVCPEVSGVSFPHPDSVPTIKAQCWCPRLSLGHGEPSPPEPWACQQMSHPDCLCPVLQISEALLPLVVGTELRAMQKPCAENCPSSGHSPGD